MVACDKCMYFIHFSFSFPGVVSFVGCTSYQGVFELKFCSSRPVVVVEATRLSQSFGLGFRFFLGFPHEQLLVHAYVSFVVWSR